MRMKNTKFACQLIVLLLFVTTSCLLNWPHWWYLAIRASSAGYCASDMACSILFVIWLYFWNEEKIDDRGSDFRHYDLSILGRIVVVCLAFDHLGLHLGSHLPSRSWHSSWGLTNHHARDPSLDYLIMIWFVPVLCFSGLWCSCCGISARTYNTFVFFWF